MVVSFYLFFCLRLSHLFFDTNSHTHTHKHTQPIHQPGDVIYIEAASGAVKRVGRCDAHAGQFDLDAEDYVPLPKGDVHKRKDVEIGRAHV